MLRFSEMEPVEKFFETVPEQVIEMSRLLL